MEWEFTQVPDGLYEVQIDWYVNNQLTDLGQDSPAQEAPYQLFVGSTRVAEVPVNQRLFPDDVALPGERGTTEPAGSIWEVLASSVNVSGGSVRVVLSDSDPAGGKFVVAGRARLVPMINDGMGGIKADNADTTGQVRVADNSNTTANTLYTESVPALFVTAPLNDVKAAVARRCTSS